MFDLIDEPWVKNTDTLQNVFNSYRFENAFLKESVNLTTSWVLEGRFLDKYQYVRNRSICTEVAAKRMDRLGFKKARAL